MNKQRTTMGVVLIIALLFGMNTASAEIVEVDEGIFLPEGFVVPGGVIGSGGFLIPSEYVVLDDVPDEDELQIYEPTCQTVWWHDDTSSECKLNTFCDAYMWYSLETFGTIEECELSIYGEPLEPFEPECNNLWWYDDSSTECQLNEWCGAYTYESLRTFGTQGACEVEFYIENPEMIPESEPLPEPKVIPTPVPLPEPKVIPTPVPLPEPKVIPTPVPLPEPKVIPTPVPLPEPKVIPTPRPLPDWFVTTVSSEDTQQEVTPETVELSEKPEPERKTFVFSSILAPRHISHRFMFW